MKRGFMAGFMAGAVVLTGMLASYPVLGATVSKQSQVATVSVPSSAQSNSAFTGILPKGEKIKRKMILSSEGQQFAVLATLGSTEIDGWIVVTKWNPSRKTWEKFWIKRSYGDWAPVEFFRGPTSSAGESTVGLLYRDGASGTYSTTYVLGITPKQVSILRFHGALLGGDMKKNGSKIETDADDYQQFSYWSGNKWVTTVTPLDKLLNEADIKVRYTLSSSKIRIVGPTTIHAKVGQTITFVPENSAAKHAVINNEIQVFTNAWSGGQVYTDMAQLLDTTMYKFTKKGTFQFDVVPPHYMGIDIDHKRVGTVTVVVS
jgi:plastocyanin